MNPGKKASAEMAQRVDELYVLNQQAQRHSEQSHQQQTNFIQGCHALFAQLEHNIGRVEKAICQSRQAAEQIEADIMFCFILCWCLGRVLLLWQTSHRKPGITAKTQG